MWEEAECQQGTWNTPAFHPTQQQEQHLDNSLALAIDAGVVDGVPQYNIDIHTHIVHQFLPYWCRSISSNSGRSEEHTSELQSQR